MEGKMKTSASDLIKNFNPVWFAAVMGTAVIPLAASFLEQDFKIYLAQFFFYMSVLIFFAALIPWLLKFFLFPGQVKKDLKHPILSNFFPTMPISLVIFALDLMKFQDVLLGAALAQKLAFWLWLLGTAGIYGFGFVIILNIFRDKGVDFVHANFGWYIPPVSKLLIPVAGFELAALLPQQAEFIFGVSMISFGVGFFYFSLSALPFITASFTTNCP